MSTSAWFCFYFHLSLQGHLLSNTSIFCEVPEVELSHHGHTIFLCYVMSEYACTTVDLLLVNKGTTPLLRS